MPPLSIMIKPASSNCNLKCKYCFYHSLAQKRESYSYGLMKESTAEKLILSALKFANGEQIYFAFQGGEPLIAGLDFYNFFIEFVKNNNTKNSKICYAMQTNGTLINVEWALFFKANNFLLGLSLDGDKSAHAYRIDKQNNNTFEIVLSSAMLLKEHQVVFNILIVATKYTGQNIESIYRFFTDRGFKYLQFIPCLKSLDSAKSDYAMENEEYSYYLIRLFNLYVKDFVRNDYTSVRYFDNLVSLITTGKAEQCGIQGHCAHQIVVEGNGNVYPCDFYCTDKYLLGNINNEELERLSKSEKALVFLKQSLNFPPKCKICKFNNICRGCGCKRYRENQDYCDAYFNFFSKCLPMFNVFIKK